MENQANLFGPSELVQEVAEETGVAPEAVLAVIEALERRNPPLAGGGEPAKRFPASEEEAWRRGCDAAGCRWVMNAHRNRQLRKAMKEVPHGVRLDAFALIVRGYLARTEGWSEQRRYLQPESLLRDEHRQKNIEAGLVRWNIEQIEAAAPVKTVLEGELRAMMDKLRQR